MAREEGFFDDLARGLVDGTLTRGKAIRLMGAAVVGSTLGSLGIGGEASADPPGCKRNGKNCTRNDQCCSRNCSGGTCQEQTTTPPPVMCTPTANPCGLDNFCGTGDCACIPIVEGGATCVTRVCTGAPCTSSAQCPSG